MKLDKKKYSKGFRLLLDNEPLNFKKLTEFDDITFKILCYNYDLSNSTCIHYAWSLGNAEHTEQLNIEGIRGTGILYWMLEKKKLIEISESQVLLNDYVIYNNSEVGEMHIGLCIDGRIQSKWGLSEVFDHNLYEVPWLYGSNIKYYKQVPFNVLLEYNKYYLNNVYDG